MSKPCLHDWFDRHSNYHRTINGRRCPICRQINEIPEGEFWKLARARAKNRGANPQFKCGDIVAIRGEGKRVPMTVRCMRFLNDEDIVICDWSHGGDCQEFAFSADDLLLTDA